MNINEYPYIPNSQRPLSLCISSENGTNCLPAWHGGVRVGVQPDCIKGQVVCGTVNWDKICYNLLGSIAEVGYHIAVPDFYLMLYGFLYVKNTNGIRP